MEKGQFFTVLAVAALLMTGCSTPVPAPASAPAVQPEFQPVRFEEMQKRAASILESGGLAVAGTHESKSLDLALNRAKTNGRIQLARMVNARIEALAKAFSEEQGIPYDSLLLSGFNHAGKVLAGQISGSVAQTLNYETAGDTFIACALMVLDPQAIADQLAKETDLYLRLHSSKAFEELNNEIKAYEAFKAAQKQGPLTARYPADTSCTTSPISTSTVETSASGNSLPTAS
jgi:hypothetical protein